MDFRDISYLSRGNLKQQAVYNLLKENAILETLSEYNPIVCGTIPIEIDIDNSDIDIICCYSTIEGFIETLKTSFLTHKGFRYAITTANKITSVVANFEIGGFEIEIFGQTTPSHLQNAYKHMAIEYQILKERDEKFRQEIIKLKKMGFKTEPAFGKMLNIQGNAYEELLLWPVNIK